MDLKSTPNSPEGGVGMRKRFLKNNVGSEKKPPTQDSGTHDLQKQHGKKSKEPYDTSASKPMHRYAQASILSSESTTSNSYRGLVNLLVIVAVVANVRLILENFVKYGILVGSYSWTQGKDNSFLPCIMAFAAVIVVNLSIAVAAEKLCSAGWSRVGAILHILNSPSPLFSPLAIGAYFNVGGFVSSGMVTVGAALFMKLVSYAHACHDLRMKQSPAYPGNVTFRNVSQFLFFPTLIYQPSYPRTDRIRKRWLAKRIFQLILSLSLMIVILEQFFVPTIRNASKPLQELDFPRIVERMLKLAIPYKILWLLMFYSLFHLWLSILAELTYFGDRLFFKAWWNSCRLDIYWRYWNLPVHNWLVRHVFFPMMNHGFSKAAAAWVVFVISAAMHEFLVSAPFRIFRLWAFFGMLGQIPLIFLTRWLDNKLKGSQFEQVGNVVFWVSFCIVGQPICILLYYFDLSSS